MKNVKLLDFKAVWCGPCQMMKPIVEEIKKELEGKVEVVEIDVDADQETAVKYGVMGIPTYIVEKAGKEIARKTGFTSKEELRKLING